MGGTALVVDDAPDVRRLLGLALTMAGYCSVEAASGIEAVRRMQDEPLPGVVVLDIQMPGLDGFETLERLRADPRTAQVPVIVCTAKGTPQDNLRAWTLGCDGFVTKPLDPQDLVTQVEGVLALDDAGRA